MTEIERGAYNVDLRLTLLFYKDDKLEWRWRLKSSNGKIIGASSESFKNFKDAQHNFELHREPHVLDVE